MAVRELLMHKFVGETTDDVCSQINEYIEHLEGMHQEAKIHEVTFSKNEEKIVAVVEYYLADY